MKAIIATDESIILTRQDIHDFIDEAKAYQSIHHFENTYQTQNEQYLVQSMLNIWSDNKGI